MLTTPPSQPRAWPRSGRTLIESVMAQHPLLTTAEAIEALREAGSL
jgi:hypothetical protein